MNKNQLRYIFWVVGASEFIVLSAKWRFHFPPLTGHLTSVSPPFEGLLTPSASGKEMKEKQ